jgi:acetyl-CoA carboxylase biotin carboxyl carrier protein
LDFEELTDIIKMVHSTDIVELELSSKKFSLTVRKKEALEQPEPVYAPAPQMYQQAPQPQASYPQVAPPPPAPSQPSPQPSAPAPAKPAAGGGDGAVEGFKITSPMAGTFYRSPAPGEPSFCKEGDKVAKGQTVCIVEAMKLMNEIEADVSGTVVKWLVQDGSLVTPGQDLLVVKQ